MVPKHLMIISMIVFIFLNIFENMIHFSIGRNIQNKDNTAFEFKMPEIYDMIKIIVVMICFAMLQGIFTYTGVLIGL